MLLCMMMTVFQLFAQTKTITGKVTDEAGTDLAGVTVSVRGSSAFAITGTNGNFSLSVPPTATELEISYVGFATQRIQIQGRTSLGTIRLASSASDLEGVVVTGYNRQKRSQYAGTASKVDEAQMRNFPVASFDQVLQGRVPGLTVLSGSGQPGAAANVILRGPTSILGGSDPLYIVDGIPVEGSVFQGLNTNDFESVDVLKDGPAVALYGNRGAAGVIVVTTKKGATGKARFGYAGQYGVKMRPQFNYRMMNSAELLAAQERLGGVLPASAATLPGWMYSKKNPVYATLDPATQAQFDRNLDSMGKINTDWDDIYFRNGKFQNHELRLSGSVGRGRLYSNFNYYNEEGIIVRSDMKRFSWRNNFDYSDDKLTFSFGSNLSYVKRNFQESTTSNNLNNPFLVTRITPGYISLLKDDGTYNVSTAQPYYGVNLYQSMLYNLNYTEQIKGILSVNANYKILPYLSFGVTAGVDFTNSINSIYRDQRAFTSYSSTNVQTKSGLYQEQNTRIAEMIVRPNITFQKVFASKHDVEVAAYGEWNREYRKIFTGLGYGADPKRPNTPAAITQGNAQNSLFSTVTGSQLGYMSTALVGIGRYTYNRKYTLNLSYRVDGSTKLPSQNRFHSFYAVGGVWDIGQESFVSGIRPINVLRLKASYGQAANSDGYLTYFQYLAGFTQGQYQGLNTFVPTSPGYGDLDWEYTNTLNLGLDFGFFNRRLYGDIAFYNKQTNNLLVNNNPTGFSGFWGTLQQINAGKMRNRGFEYSVNYDLVRNRNLSVTLNANGAINNNEITDLGSASQFEFGTGLIRVGYALGSHYEIKWAGVDAATGAPLFYTEDGKVTNDLSKAFRFQDYGTWMPRITGGFGANVKFKGFELTAQFSYAKETYRVNNLEFFVENPSFLVGGFNQAASFNFWTKPGDITSTQSPAYQNSFSSKYIQDASFLRLRTLMLSYQLPKNITGKLKHISNARFYIMGQNLLTWTKWRGYDPEDDNNISLSEFPNPRAITAGVDITF